MNKPYCETCGAAKKENQRLKKQLEEAVKVADEILGVEVIGKYRGEG